MPAVEVFGTIAIFIMVVSYALEKRRPVFVAVFAAGCALAAIYAFLIHSWPFVIAEGVWAVVALRRWREARRSGD